MKLKSDPSKQEEINHYQKFIKNLPQDSYLFMILKDTPYIIEREIKTDFALPLVSSQEVESMKATIKRYETEIKELRGKSLLFDYMLRRFKRLHRRHIRKFKDISKQMKRQNNWLSTLIKDLREENRQLSNKYDEVKNLHEYLNN